MPNWEVALPGPAGGRASTYRGRDAGPRLWWIVATPKTPGNPVEYGEYPDEGHGFVKADNRLDFFRKAEAFLEKYLNP